MRVAHLPHGDGMDEVEVPRHERFKRRLGPPGGKFPHERHVIGCLHSLTYARQTRNRTNYFELFLAGGGRVTDVEAKPKAAEDWRTPKRWRAAWRRSKIAKRLGVRQSSGASGRRADDSQQDQEGAENGTQDEQENRPPSRLARLLHGMFGLVHGGLESFHLFDDEHFQRVKSAGENF
jgi:hypothetical protein